MLKLHSCMPQVLRLVRNTTQKDYGLLIFMEALALKSHRALHVLCPGGCVCAGHIAQHSFVQYRKALPVKQVSRRIEK